MAWIRFQTGSAVFNTSVSLRYNSPLACKILMTTRKAALKTYFLTGLLILVPLAITLWVISLIIGAMDQTLTLLPEAWQPERLLGFHLPGLGTLLTIAFILPSVCSRRTTSARRWCNGGKRCCVIFRCSGRFIPALNRSPIPYFRTTAMPSVKRC